MSAIVLPPSPVSETRRQRWRRYKRLLGRRVRARRARLDAMIATNDPGRLPWPRRFHRGDWRSLAS